MIPRVENTTSIRGRLLHTLAWEFAVQGSALEYLEALCFCFSIAIFSRYQ